MADRPIELDAHRGMAAQQATESRRHDHGVVADQAALAARQADLEDRLDSFPSPTPADTADKARYLIELFRQTPEAQDPRRRRLIDSVLSELADLSKT